MCEAENCITIRYFQLASEGIDSSCIYSQRPPVRSYEGYASETPSVSY